MNDTSPKAPAARNKNHSGRRIGSEQSLTRSKLLDTVEQLMLKEGYAAISSRRVAKETGVKPSLVHYYFPTTDDLLLASFRRAVESEVERQDAAGEQSLQQLWHSYQNHERTVLAMEFMALANHRPAIKAAMASYTERTRQRRAALLASLVDMEKLQPGCSAEGLSVLLISVARTLAMEDNLGIGLGHEDARTFVEHWLQQLQHPAD